MLNVLNKYQLTDRKRVEGLATILLSQKKMTLDWSLFFHAERQINDSDFL